MPKDPRHHIDGIGIDHGRANTSEDDPDEGVECAPYIDPCYSLTITSVDQDRPNDELTVQAVDTDR